MPNPGSHDEDYPPYVTHRQLERVIDRAVGAERDYVDARVRAERDFADAQRQAIDIKIQGVERASQALADEVNRVPTRLQSTAQHIREIIDEMRSAIDEKFESRDRAIDKAELSLNEGLEKQERLFQTSIKSLEDQLAEVRRRLDLIEGRKEGASAQRGMIYAFGGFVSALVVVGAILAGGGVG